MIIFSHNNTNDTTLFIILIKLKFANLILSSNKSAASALNCTATYTNIIVTVNFASAVNGIFLLLHKFGFEYEWLKEFHGGVITEELLFHNYESFLPITTPI